MVQTYIIDEVETPDPEVVYLRDLQKKLYSIPASLSEEEIGYLLLNGRPDDIETILQMLLLMALQSSNLNIITCKSIAEEILAPYELGIYLYPVDTLASMLQQQLLAKPDTLGEEEITHILQDGKPADIEFILQFLLHQYQQQNENNGARINILDCRSVSQTILSMYTIPEDSPLVDALIQIIHRQLLVCLEILSEEEIRYLLSYGTQNEIETILTFLLDGIKLPNNKLNILQCRTLAETVLERYDAHQYISVVNTLACMIQHRLLGLHGMEQNFIKIIDEINTHDLNSLAGSINLKHSFAALNARLDDIFARLQPWIEPNKYWGIIEAGFAEQLQLTINQRASHEQARWAGNGD